MKIKKDRIIAAMERVIERVISMREELNQLDAAMGDGDTGITASKGATGLRDYLAANPESDDLGLFFINAGKAINKNASSTLGTLTAVSLMRAGKEIQGSTYLTPHLLVQMLSAIDKAVQELGKAQPGDKTIVDVIHPAAENLSVAILNGKDLQYAGKAMLEAARKGRDSVVPLRSKKGRGAWVGDRSENRPDPGTVLFVSIFEAIVNE